MPYYPYDAGRELKYAYSVARRCANTSFGREIVYNTVFRSIFHRDWIGKPRFLGLSCGCKYRVYRLGGK